MTDKPMRTTETMMRLDMEEQRLEHRDRQVAMSIGYEMTDRFFDPERVEQIRDVREQIQRAAEMAAYAAIQKERELHAGDMAMLRKWSEVKWAEELLKPPAPVVIMAPSDKQTPA